MIAEQSDVLEIRAEFPAKLRPLFQPRRYKVMHGGRGAESPGQWPVRCC